MVTRTPLTPTPSTPRKVKLKANAIGRPDIGGGISPVPISPKPTVNVGGSNPLQSDPELLQMIEKLELVNNARQFKQWRSSFLNRFEEFVEEAGAAKAQTAYDNFRKSMEKLVKKVHVVQDAVQVGDLTPEKTTVKARNTLNECSNAMKQVIQEEKALVPSRSAEERIAGYTKFNLGAVLVRDNFSEFGRMNKCNDILKVLKEGGLARVADKQQLEQIDDFNEQMRRFCDLMADLGLFEVMMKCWQFGDEGEEFVWVDLKTGQIGTVPVKFCVDAGFVHTIQDKRGNDKGFKEAVTDEEEHTTIVGLVRDTLKI